MTDTLEKRRKRLFYRSHHRGTQELDLLIGRFADRYLAGFDQEQLGRFEALLEIPEPVMYDWLVGRGKPPERLNHDVMKLLLNFQFSSTSP